MAAVGADQGKAIQRREGRAVERHAPGRLVVRSGAERHGLVEQVMPRAVALEELVDGDAGQRMGGQARVGRPLG